MDLMDIDTATTDAIYAPLAATDAFRLMVLQPGQRHEPIVVQLHTVSAGSVTEYDAISYVWGNPQQTVSILCNGISTNVTVNLHAALVQIRSQDISRVLWADALCINQNDKVERGRQVTIMGSIYSSARLVLACMGSSPDGGAAKIASLLTDYAPVMDTTPPPTMDPRWQSFAYLLRKDWFTRAWVLQEVGLARNPRVVYDNVDFSYRGLMAAAKWVTLHSPGFATRAGIPGLLIHTYWTDWSPESWARDPFVKSCGLLDLLDHGSLLSCQDPRDHIYAFLGHPLAASRTGKAIVPDYEKDVNQVYREATIFLLRETGIRTLSSAEHDQATLADYTTPSWVVRWDVGYTLNNIHLHPSASYGACGTHSVPKIDLQEDVLQVVGASLDTIKHVYHMEQRTSTFEIVFTNQATRRTGTLEDLLSYLQGADHRKAYDEPQALALAQTLCVDRITREDRTTFVQAWNAFRDWNRSGQLSAVSRTATSRRLVEKFWHMMLTACQGRAFIITERGRYGIASHCSSPGDVCCVFYGGLVPFLLRPRRGDIAAQTKGNHRLVGEAYLHGLMLGEAVRMLERKEAVEEVFDIY